MENDACEEERGAGTLCKLTDVTPLAQKGGSVVDRLLQAHGIHDSSLWGQSKFSRANSPTTTPSKHSYAGGRARLCLQAKQL